MKSIKLCLFLLALHVTVAGAESVRNNSVHIVKINDIKINKLWILCMKKYIVTG